MFERGNAISQLRQADQGVAQQNFNEDSFLVVNSVIPVG